MDLVSLTPSSFNTSMAPRGDALYISGPTDLGRVEAPPWFSVMKIRLKEFPDWAFSEMQPKPSAPKYPPFPKLKIKVPPAPLDLKGDSNFIALKSNTVSGREEMTALPKRVQVLELQVEQLRNVVKVFSML
jgi:hypothetical protein